MAKNYSRPYSWIFVLVLAPSLLVMMGLGETEGTDPYEPLNLTSAGQPLSAEDSSLVHSFLPDPDLLGYSASADLDGDGNNEIVILCEGIFDIEPGEAANASGILSNIDGQLVYLYRCPPNFKNINPLIFDFDANGAFDLFFASWSGGNGFHTLEPVLVWWDGSTFQQEYTGRWKGVYDFDHDGVIEIETTVVMTGLSESAWACDPVMLDYRTVLWTASMIMGFRDGEIRNVSEQYPGFFRDKRLPIISGQIEKFHKKKETAHSPEYVETLDCLIDCLQPVINRASRLAEGSN